MHLTLLFLIDSSAIPGVLSVPFLHFFQSPTIHNKHAAWTVTVRKAGSSLRGLPPCHFSALALQQCDIKVYREPSRGNESRNKRMDSRHVQPILNTSNAVHGNVHAKMARVQGQPAGSAAGASSCAAQLLATTASTSSGATGTPPDSTSWPDSAGHGGG